MKNFSSLKNSTLFLLLLGLVLQANACSNENPPSEMANLSQIDYFKLIPAETNLLIYANFENLKTTSLGESIKNELSTKIETEDDEDYKNFMKKTGIDLKRDIHQIWFCSMVENENKSESDAGAIIEGSNFDEEKILQYIEEQDDNEVNKTTYNGHTIYSNINDHDDDSGFTFLRKGLVAIGKETWLHSIIDQEGSNTNILDNKNMSKYINNIQQKNHLWGVFHLDGLSDDWAQKIRSESAFKGTEAIEKLKSLYFYTKFSDKTDIFIKGDFTTNTEAELVAETMIGFKAMAKLMMMDDKEAIDMLNDIKIKTEGSVLEVTTKVDEKFIDKLKEKQNTFSTGKVRLL